ncbi:hypothetical protein L6164_024892 [Bauhinia variegata]|uniref:Uncharacterized protein n=2 Tax=Bauhinia variegata TaxID=167791 RepID=A0ACB9LZ76_BAUVA|nr:hypothetical protein L6164_024892 [Bauhinia variegata]
MRNIDHWLKLISPSRKPGGGTSRKDYDEDNFCSNPNVDEEYLKAFRTTSYIEICNKAQGQLGKTNIRRVSSSSSLFLHLTEHLLEPRQETITKLTESLSVHRLLVEYFEASLEACLYCDTILEGIYQMRLAYRKIKRVLKLSKMVLDRTDTDQAICGDLASFTLQRNPLSIITPGQFRDIHDRYMVLLQRLKSKGSKIRQKLKFKRICKKVGRISLVISHSALVIALLVLAFHSVVGIVAAPAIVGCLLGLFRKRVKSVRGRGKQNTRASERLGEQLDFAAKGVYILINDFDTMSRMVRRLHDEVEHWKVVADMCVKNGKCEILKQALREFDAQDSSFLDQLKELEQHIYLCFLTINRSRRLVIEEIMDKES